MPSIDLKVFNHRNREIRRLVRRGSPALVYSGPMGIAIAAVLRPGVTWRVGQVMDRMAIIGRGDPVARGFIHKVALTEASEIATAWSDGGVLGHEPAHKVAAALQVHNGRYLLGPALPVEACFVQLNATPETDYLAYISFEGTVRTFRHAWFLGEVGVSREDATPIQREEAASQINERLALALGDYERFEDLWEALARLEIPEVRALRNSSKLDVVVLDRRALKRAEYEKVFTRLTL